MVIKIQKAHLTTQTPTIWTDMMEEVQKCKTCPESGFVCAFAGCWVGASGLLAYGPVSEVPVNSRPWQGVADLRYGNDHGLLLMFIGIAAALSVLDRARKRIRFEICDGG